MTATRSFFNLMGLGLLIYPLGFLNQILMSNYFGTSAEVDAYWIIMAIVNLLTFYIHPVREAIVPEYYKNKENDFKGSQRYFSQTINLVILILLISGCSFFLFPEPIIHFVINKQHPALLEKVNSLKYFVIPLFTLTALTEILTGILISYKKVIFQNVGRFLGVVISITFLFLFAESLQIKAVVFALILAQTILFLLQLKELRTCGLRYQLFSIPKTNRKTKQVVSALLLGYAFSQVYIIYERNVFSFFGEGIIAGYQYAQSLGQIPQNIFVVALSAVLWTKFLKYSSEKNLKDLQALTILVCKRLTFLLTFCSFFLAFFSKELIYFFYFRGAFNLDSLNLTSKCLIAVSLSLAPFGVYTLLTRLLITLQHTKKIILVGLINVLAGFGILLLSRYLNWMELSVYHFFTNVFVGSIISILFVIKATNIQLNVQRVSRFFLWCIKLSILFGVLYFYPKPSFEVTDKVTIFFQLGFHFIALSLLYFSGLIFLKLLPLQEVKAYFEVAKKVLFRNKTSR